MEALRDRRKEGEMGEEGKEGKMGEGKEGEMGEGKEGKERRGRRGRWRRERRGRWGRERRGEREGCIPEERSATLEARLAASSNSSSLSSLLSLPCRVRSSSDESWGKEKGGRRKKEKGRKYIL